MSRRRRAALLVVAALAATATSAAGEREAASPVFGVRLPKSYRDWPVISVAHEAGNLNDLRAVVGNEIAVKAFRSGVRPFPDGAIIARLAWKYVPSERNNAVFGQAQSFVAGDPTNVQISVKDTRRYARTGGWGYGQFENGRPNPSATLMNGCFGCHARLEAQDDFVFTRYAP